MTPRKIARYGWRPDLPDQRDRVYSVPELPHPTPPHFTLVPQCPPVFDQGQLGSCTGNAIAGALQFIMLAEDAAKAFEPSRLAIYYDERAIEGTVSVDAGAQIRDGIKVVASKGSAPESLCPYNIDDFANKPSDAYYAAAKLHPAIAYARVPQSLSALRGAILARDPVVFGFTVYESFESDEVATTGVVPMPASGETVLGGHAVLCVGYDDVEQRFIVRNSWGPYWGNHGYFAIPYAYLLNPNLASDFWVVSRVKE